MIPDQGFRELAMVIVSWEIYLGLESHSWMHCEDCFSRVIARTVLRFQLSCRLECRLHSFTSRDSLAKIPALCEPSASPQCTGAP